MAVALSTPQRQPHPDSAECVDSIKHILNPRFFRITTTFSVVHVIPVKTRCQNLFRRCIFQKVACELLNREAIKRHIVVVRINHPISPRPILSSRVCLVPVRIRIPGRIQPDHGHSFAVVLRRQQFVNKFVVSSRRLIAQVTMQLLA